jgi:hypothetical protein
MINFTAWSDDYVRERYRVAREKHAEIVAWRRAREARGSPHRALERADVESTVWIATIAQEALRRGIELRD